MVQVSFDAAGGDLGGDNVRVVRLGATYGEVFNIYPSDRPDLMSDLRDCTLSANVFATDIPASRTYTTCVCHFTEGADGIAAGVPYRYVVDVLSAEGSAVSWWCGTTSEARPSYLSPGGVGAIDGAAIRVVPLVGRGDGEFLDRAYAAVLPGNRFSVRWRVSLFPGTAITAENYAYVEPGKSIRCGLPVPTRVSCRFVGWVDEDGQPVTESTLVTNPAIHTLHAVWD